MRRKLALLHKFTCDFIERKGPELLVESLPVKTECVLHMAPSAQQQELYTCVRSFLYVPPLPFLQW